MLLPACTAPGSRTGGADTPVAPALPVLHREDTLWLQRVSFGLDGASVADYRRLGRERFLDDQLAARDQALPAAVKAQIDALEISHADPVRWLVEVNAQYKDINAMADGIDKEQARKSLNDRGNKLAYQTVRRDLLRALYSGSQLQEQMIWFWLNHFSVYQYKANLRWLVSDYEETAIRPHALGHFYDLVHGEPGASGDAAIPRQQPECRRAHQ
jgi:hypothetical protein